MSKRKDKDKVEADLSGGEVFNKVLDTPPATTLRTTNAFQMLGWRCPHCSKTNISAKSGSHVGRCIRCENWVTVEMSRLAETGTDGAKIACWP